MVPIKTYEEYMDDMSTPIEALQRPMPQMQQSEGMQQSQPIMDYNEILRTVQEEQMPQVQSQPMHAQSQASFTNNQEQQYMPPPPMVQSLKPQMGSLYSEPSSFAYQKTRATPINNNTIDHQKDILVILIVCSIIFNEQFQNVMKKFIPSLFRNDRITAIGTIACAGIVASSFYVSKTVSLKFG